MDRRELKAHVLGCLNLKDNDAMESALQALSGRRVVGPLMGAFCHEKEEIRWSAVTGMGSVCEALFPKDPEGVRRVMRRLIWMLNDESGGIGWGCGEAMGEIMARIPIVAHEYHRILCSYMDPEGNFQENPLLQRGILWGLARLAQSFPVLVQEMIPVLSFPLDSDDPEILASALMLARMLKDPSHTRYVEKHLEDSRGLLFYWNGDFIPVKIGELAGQCCRDSG
ncbi:DVU0298 family protein [Desulfobotulus mexicanus]|uniref:HEAT repeat domain-containing protein n=1 Tax=Desulfobotulus mexicanus TaxID=2586642 RepID=A0A5Q4VB34_9BACT|nr:DVU0298 family protein [Desulfobotulus mexicanus]TYT74964.1 HEAT repeat domain-containing protein [Desulfobotulus mexicanus]